jgi:hypothetical protein
MTETPTGSDLEQLVVDWADAGLPPKRIAPVAAALERRAALDQQARELEAGSHPLNGIARLIASGELDLGEGLLECQRRAAWSMQASSSQRTQLGPALAGAARGACLQLARLFVSSHAAELLELAQARANEGDGVAAGVVAWLQRFTHVEPAQVETRQEPAEVSGGVYRRTKTGDVVWG